MNWNDYIVLREELLEKFELGRISEETLDLHLKRIDRKAKMLDLKPVKEVEEEEDWIDPAGGIHSGYEDDPAAMYI